MLRCSLRLAPHGSSKRLLPLRAMRMAVRGRPKKHFEDLPGHEDVAFACFNKAKVYVSEGKYEMALELYKKSIDIWTKELSGPDVGPQHAIPHNVASYNVASSYNNIAGVYLHQGKHEMALELYEKSLAIRCKVLGPDHRDVANSYNNMGAVHASQRKYEIALELHQKSLAIWIKLGSPDVATAYTNMAYIFHAQEKHEDALDLFRNCLDISVKAHGVDDASVATAYRNMATVLEAQGKDEEAQALLDNVEHLKALEAMIRRS